MTDTTSMAKQSNSDVQRFTCFAYGGKLNADFKIEGGREQNGAALFELDMLEQHCVPAPESLSHSVPVPSNHGRALSLRTDSPLDELGKGRQWLFVVEGVATFFWVAGESLIQYRPDLPGEHRHLSFWILHTLLPLFLSLEGRFDFLHAGAVEVDGGIAMFIAPSMGGKSTTTGYFVQQGHALVADDKLATFLDSAGCLLAVPSHEHYRPYRNVEDLGFRAEHRSEAPGEVVAIYVLERVNAQHPVTITRLSGFRRFERLMPNYLFGMPALVKWRMQYLSNLANRVPVFQLTVPWDIQRLGEVYKAVLDHFPRQA